MNAVRHASLAVALLVTLGAAPPSPPASLPAIPPSLHGGGFCNVTVGIAVPLPGNKIAFGLATPAHSGRASGVLSVFSGTERYDVRFVDAAVPSAFGTETFGTDHSATPIVVQFPGPVSLDAAVVSALGTSPAEPCKPYYSPYSRRGSLGWSHIEAGSAFAERALAAAPVKPFATAPFAPAVCDQRITAPVTVQAFEPDIPDEAAAKKWKGDTTVLVTVDATGRVVDARTQTSSGHPTLDAVAEDAARRTVFKAGTFDCAPVVGSYLFVVSFGS